MYTIKIDEKQSILELNINENPNEDELRIMLRDLKHIRRKFSNDGYRLLIILPDNLRNANIDEREKIDLSAFTSKLISGLKHVVLQTPESNSENINRLKEIYNQLSIQVNVTKNEIESQKILGLI